MLKSVNELISKLGSERLSDLIEVGEPIEIGFYSEIKNAPAPEPPIFRCNSDAPCATSGLYLFFVKGALVYIGKGSNTRNRIHDHLMKILYYKHSQSVLYPGVTFFHQKMAALSDFSDVQIFVLPVAEKNGIKGCIELIESYLIYKIKPEYNSVGKGVPVVA